MRTTVTGPAGAEWEVTASRLRWRPRRRRIGDLDPIGLVLAVLSLPLLAVEWLAAGLVALVKPGRSVVARTAGPPSRHLTWHLSSPAAARAKAAEVVALVADGADVDADADEREVGT